MNQKERDRIMS